MVTAGNFGTCRFKGMAFKEVGFLADPRKGAMIMKTVLVTGGCGLIGQHLCSGLLKKQFAVIAVDRESSVYNEGKYNYEFIQANPDDRNAYAEIFDKYKIDIVVHAACTVDNDLGPIIGEEQIKESANCDKFIYRYAMTNDNVKMFILLSTDQVYEFPKTREPIREDADIKTNTNYSVLKYNAEKALISEMQHHKEVMCCITRVSPVYTLNYTENLLAKITDPKDGTKFVSGKGQYGFQLCCVSSGCPSMPCGLPKYATPRTTATGSASSPLQLSRIPYCTQGL